MIASASLMAPLLVADVTRAATLVFAVQVVDVNRFVPLAQGIDGTTCLFALKTDFVILFDLDDPLGLLKLGQWLALRPSERRTAVQGRLFVAFRFLVCFWVPFT